MNFNNCAVSADSWCTDIVVGGIAAFNSGREMCWKRKLGSRLSPETDAIFDPSQKRKRLMAGSKGRAYYLLLLASSVGTSACFLKSGSRR